MRKSPRIEGFDYATAGTYFVTICTKNMELRFGMVIEAGMKLNDAGMMIASTWETNVEQYPSLGLDLFVVMPNHLHTIVHVGVDPSIAIDANSLVELIQTFKSLSTIEYGRGVRAGLNPPFDRALWQRSFYDRILRDDAEIEMARRYIDGNPGRWFERHTRS